MQKEQQKRNMENGYNNQYLIQKIPATMESEKTTSHSNNNISSFKKLPYQNYNNNRNKTTKTRRRRTGTTKTTHITRTTTTPNTTNTSTTTNQMLILLLRGTRKEELNT